MNRGLGAVTAALLLVAGLGAAETTSGASASAAPVKRHGTSAPKAAIRVVIGQTAAATYGSCSPLNLTILAGQSGGAPTYDVPGAGVLTSVSTHGNANGGSFRAVVYSTPGPNRTLVAKSSVLTIAPNVLNTWPVRLPVPDAATLGYNTATVGASCALIGTSPNDWLAMDVEDPETSSTFYDYAIVDKQRPNVSAVWESDGDGDGYGDVSQDACPQSALSHDACPAPDTVLSKKPARHTTKRRTKVRFSSTVPGSTFLCRLDHRSAKPCSAPYKVTVGPGRHKIVVIAVSPAGIRDPSPASVTFRVRPRQPG